MYKCLWDDIPMSAMTKADQETASDIYKSYRKLETEHFKLSLYVYPVLQSHRFRSLVGELATDEQIALMLRAGRDVFIVGDWGGGMMAQTCVLSPD